MDVAETAYMKDRHAVMLMVSCVFVSDFLSSLKLTILVL